MTRASDIGAALRAALEAHDGTEYTTDQQYIEMDAALSQLKRALSQPPDDRRFRPGMAVAVVSRHPNEGHNYVGRVGVVADGQDHDKATWVHFLRGDRVERVSVPNAHLCEAAQDSGLPAEGDGHE